jgi:hypothetical protein
MVQSRRGGRCAGGRRSSYRHRRAGTANQGADRPTTRIPDHNDSIDSLLFNVIGL